VRTVLRYEMLFCASMKAVVLSPLTFAVQIPCRPLPVAAVEPACGLVRLGSVSPLTVGVDAADGALAAEGDEALVAAGVVDEPEPPPPPQAVRTSDATRDNANSGLFFISVCFIQASAGSHVRNLMPLVRFDLDFSC
jgi:hypothetical protein